MQCTMPLNMVQADVVVVRQEEYRKLLELVQELRMEVDKLRKENDTLREENRELRRRLGLNSTNSSKPPSSDPPAVRYPQKVCSGRKRGKQPGDRGHRRQLLTPTQVVNHRPDVCWHCGAGLLGDIPAAGVHERRQQVEIPQVEPIVTEHCYHTIRCPHCGGENKAEARGEEKLCCGPRLSALMATLSTVHNMTRRHIEELVEAVVGVRMSLGTIDNRIQETGAALKEAVEALRKQLSSEGSLNIDETGWKKKGERHWLWTFVAPAFTYFHIAKTRSKQVLEDILGYHFNGVIISDRHGLYRCYQGASKWQVCLAHLIREAKGLGQSEEDETSRFGHWVRHELKLMITLRKEGKAKSLQMNSCKARLRRACTLSRDSKNKHVRNLARGILKDWDAVVLFTKIEGIPPTNNVAEQSLRSLVISRKISFGNQCESGLVTTARLRTIAATAKNQGVKVWDYLTNALIQHRSGQPVSLLTNPPSG